MLAGGRSAGFLFGEDMIQRRMGKFVVISLGGSLIVPHLSDDGGIDVAFLRKFRALILAEIQSGKKFVIITGGGKTCRVYQSAMRKFGHVRDADLDFIGVQSTRLNASVVWTVLRQYAYPEIINDILPDGKFIKLKKSSARIFIACGGEPGKSTDFGAVKLAAKFGAKEVINASNIAFAYDKDPRKYKDAKPIREISWREYRKLIPVKWSPGLSTPIDPVAARLAEKIGLWVKIIKGSDLKNFKRAIDDKPFRGTIIS